MHMDAPPTRPALPESLLAKLHALVTVKSDGKASRDVPEQIADVQPRNFFTHVISLAATKTGDGLADAKLVLSWLLAALGAPPFLIGLLVPVREAGSLLPQLFTADRIRHMPQRKWAWALGSLLQGFAVAGMAIAAFTLEGVTCGGVIVALLAVFAVARSVCSVAYKDVLGRTVSKSTRGTATGLAATVAAVLVFTFGVLISVDVIPRTTNAVAIALLVAACLWLISAGMFCVLVEPKRAAADHDAEGNKASSDNNKSNGKTGGSKSYLHVLRHLSLLKTDKQLTRFIAARGLLTATALAPPYILALSGMKAKSGLGNLGLFVIASSAAAIASSYIWGRLADRSSRKVLMAAGVVAAIVLSLTAAVSWFASSLQTGETSDNSEWILQVSLPAFFFVLMIAYQGVRLGRSTHIVDMASEENRAIYTAVSNTVIGILLIISGTFGAIAQLLSYEAVLILFAAMSAAAALVAKGLEEVQLEHP